MFATFCRFLLSIALLFALISCESKSTTSSNLETVTLKDFKTIISVEDNTLAVPSIINYYNSSLFVYDKRQSRVLELNKKGQIENRYGRSGRGPGEFVKVKNIFLNQNHLYVVDSRQYYIHKYDLNGNFISSMDYGKAGGFGRPNVPSAPVSRSHILPKNVNNQPIVTGHGNVLLSSVQFSDSVQTIYELMDWQGNHIADIGLVPAGNELMIDYSKLKADVDNRVVPAFYRAKVFPVVDQAQQDEYFLIYSAFPKIEKYNANGKKLWETKIESISEIDSIKNHFYETMEDMQQTDPRNRINLEYYMAGVSSPDGALYLIMDTNPLRIHQFNEQGNLLRRYKLSSNDVDNLPIFTIDFTESRIFVVTEEGEIRAYPFK